MRVNRITTGGLKEEYATEFWLQNLRLNFVETTFNVQRRVRRPRPLKITVLDYSP